MTASVFQGVSSASHPDIEVDSAGSDRAEIDAAWEGKAVVIRNINEPAWQLTQSRKRISPNFLTLEVTEARAVTLPNDLSCPVEVHIRSADRVSIAGHPVSTLVLIGGAVEVRFQSGVDTVTVDECSALLPSSLDRLLVRGQSAIGGLTSVTELVLEPMSSLELPRPRNNHAQTLSATTFTALDSTLINGELQVSDVKEALDVRLKGATLIVGDRNAAVELPDTLTISGRGALQLNRVKGTVHIDDGAVLTLFKLDRSHVSVSGRAHILSLETDNRTTILADGLGLRNVSKLGSSELHGVSLSELLADQVQNLDQAKSLSLWWPPGWRKRLHLEEDPRQRRVPPGERTWRSDFTRPFRGDPVPIEDRERKHHKWRRIAEVLDEKGAPGSDQAQARYAAYRWRLRALRGRNGRFLERLILRAYWLMGFGVRPLRPALVWASAVGALSFTGFECDSLTADPEAPIKTWWSRVLLLASSVLRTLRVPLAECSATSVVLAQVLGIVCLAFTLLAIRRIARHGA